jgi:hypothetical protein
MSTPIVIAVTELHQLSPNAISSDPNTMFPEPESVGRTWPSQVAGCECRSALGTVSRLPRPSIWPALVASRP